MLEPGQIREIRGMIINTDPVAVTSVTEAPPGKLSRGKRLQLGLEKFSTIARIIIASPLLGPINTFLGIRETLRPYTTRRRVLMGDYTPPQSASKESQPKT